MKMFKAAPGYFPAYAALAVMALFIARPGLAQDPDSKEPKKKVMIKVFTDDNGKKTVIDTTFTDWTDSGVIDSVMREVDKVIMVERDGKKGRLHVQDTPGGFEYDFDFPDLPEGLGEMGEFEWEKMIPRWVEAGPRGWGGEYGNRVMRFREGGQSLNDVLGDIPMERVKSYSIKDTKHGKRIVIDLEDGPVVERREKVIILRDPAPKAYHRGKPHKKVKVYVNPGDGKVEAGDTPSPGEAPDAPPPPPPPPAKKI